MNEAVRPVAAAPAVTPDAPARKARRITPMQLWWSFVIVLEITFILTVLGLSLSHENFALDYRWHMEASQRLLDIGTPYHQFQFEGHYSFQQAPILYPPIAFALFIPFLWLPPFLWWAIPIALILFCVTRHRPPLWAWALTLALLTGPGRCRSSCSGTRACGSSHSSRRARSGRGRSRSSCSSRRSRPSRCSGRTVGRGGSRWGDGGGVAPVLAGLVRLAGRSSGTRT